VADDRHGRRVVYACSSKSRGRTVPHIVKPEVADTGPTLGVLQRRLNRSDRVPVPQEHPILPEVVTYRKFPFSDLSYLLIAIFMTLHAVGAHHTYSEVPVGFWLKDALGLSRNHFDRIVHFAFGLLLAYPIRELLIRRAGAHDPWSYVLAVTVVQACSDLFEIIESWVALIVEPDLGNAYLGTQGDEWDAQRDMTAAFTGAVLAALATYAFAKSSTRKLKPAT
jgi:putative membrane protein